MRGILSSRPNWIPPPPHPQGNVAPPPFGSKWETLARGEGVGGHNADEGTDTLVLYVRVYHNTPPCYTDRCLLPDGMHRIHPLSYIGTVNRLFVNYSFFLAFPYREIIRKIVPPRYQIWNRTKNLVNLPCAQAEAR